ncbi:hypothetical protein EPN29_04480 [bacterium]|nr:MAG: hypothetical protein EPN29_04480 [bacterium]
MKAVPAVLRDRRRSQRGSVLSGVLIIVAFLSILAGALMTELTTNFLISRTLVNRLATEATVNSAVELAFDQLQNAPLGSPCPALSPVSLNGRTAAAAYLSCALVVDSRSPQFIRIASSSPFTIDGTYVSLNGRPEYLVADSNATVYEYSFGRSVPGWAIQVEGTLSGPPAAMLDVYNPPGILDLVPTIDSSDGDAGPGCGPQGFCVAVLAESPGSAPQPQCSMASNARVVGRPAAGISFPGLAFFGDAGGTLFAYAPNDCALQDSYGPLGPPIVAGPVVLAGPNGKKSASDEIYAVASDGSSSRLLHFTYGPGKNGAGLTLASSLPLPGLNAVGMASERGSVPARLAVTFAGGRIVEVQVNADFSMSVAATQSVPSSIAGAPYWCHCPGADLIGVGGNNGLYVFDTGLNAYGTYPATGTAINTAPGADSAGDWFFGADDGNVYEVQRPAGQAVMILAARFGNLGARVGSSPVVGGCPAGICIYLATRFGTAYLIPLDARDAAVTACLSAAPPACSGANPRLWAHVQVGVMGSPRTVHVTGWSYYSP